MMGNMIKTSIRLVASLGALAVAVACGGRGRVAVPGSPDITISRAAMNTIQDRWQGAELGSPVSATCGNSEQPPSVFRGDFNGDAIDDLIVRIAAGGSPRLVALIGRLGDEYSPLEVASGADAGAVASLEIGPRGSQYRLAGSVNNYHYGQDTLIVRACDGSRTAYLWTGNAFRPDKLAS